MLSGNSGMRRHWWASDLNERRTLESGRGARNVRIWVAQTLDLQFDPDLVRTVKQTYVLPQHGSSKETAPAPLLDLQYTVSNGATVDRLRKSRLAWWFETADAVRTMPFAFSLLGTMD